MGSLIKYFILYMLVEFNVQIADPLKIQSLDGSWFLKNTEKGYELPATVPGGIYSDLMKNGIIQNIFYGLNDINSRWVSKLNWNYTRSFMVQDPLLNYNNINIVFDGVDTFSKIIINDVTISSTENMFVRYAFNIKQHLKSGNNTIEVQFSSPVNVARILYEKQAKNYPVPPECVPQKYNGECHVNHIRKMQASFAWDWGPAFPSVGLWKTVYVEAYNSTVLRDVTVSISTDLNDFYWDIRVCAFFAEISRDNAVEGTLKIKVVTDVAAITHIYSVRVKRNEEEEFLTTVNFTIPKSYVKLWWPNGYGDPSLYEMQVTFTDLHGLEESNKIIKIGFRTIELVQNALRSGRTFYFKINGIPIFMKGSNMIPISILPELDQDDTKIKFLLQSAKDVHMNMLRVWGGGLYESDTFYNLADELGILIWQDFMFACSMYPATDEFLRNVKGEVKQQVRRLQHHPSIIVWAGNNENEVALSTNWYGTKNNFSIYQNDYKALYVDTIKREVLKNDDTRPFVTSSPSNGIKSDTENYISTNPQSVFYGDVHYYNYVLDSWDENIYPISRFTSEYGYQSLPCIQTLLTATNNTEDLEINSEFLTSRQHHTLGYLLMELLIDYQLKLPNENSKTFYKAYIFYSQIIQAMAIKTETEHYRRWRSSANDAGEGLTMGALYWQLNDVWVAPSWSSIDFSNNWKMLHYYAKNFFAPIIITSEVTDKKLSVYIVSDLRDPIFKAVLNITVYRWNSFKSAYRKTIKTNIIAGASRKVYESSLLSHDHLCDKNILRNCFVYFTLTNKYGESIAPNNAIFLAPLKHVHLHIPLVKISGITQIDGTATNFKINITTTTITLFVWLETKDIPGQFSENGFLQVTKEKLVGFSTRNPTNMNRLQKSLTVTNLLDPQYI